MDKTTVTSEIYQGRIEKKNNILGIILHLKHYPQVI